MVAHEVIALFLVRVGLMQLSCLIRGLGQGICLKPDLIRQVHHQNQRGRHEPHLSSFEFTLIFDDSSPRTLAHMLQGPILSKLDSVTILQPMD